MRNQHSGSELLTGVLHIPVNSFQYVIPILIAIKEFGRLLIVSLCEVRRPKVYSECNFSAGNHAADIPSRLSVTFQEMLVRS